MPAPDRGKHKPEKLPAAPPRRRGADGFSLLEVLVATTLMGLVLVVLLQILTTALRCQDLSWGRTQALLVAEKVLQENCEINSLNAGTYQGREGHFDYRVQVTPQYSYATAQVGTQMLCSIIQVTVTWQERGTRKVLTLQTIKTGVQRRS
jgi:prepilin-type N-terminal cleavage/methylation domain-containing protein